MDGARRKTSPTMSGLVSAGKRIRELQEQERLTAELFTRGTGELRYCMEHILNAWLMGREKTYLTTGTCPEPYAGELRGMGFGVTPMGPAGQPAGYCISWEGTTDETACGNTPENDA